VTISDKNRKRFEGIGLEFIKRELTVGNSYYLRTPEECGEGQEWVSEQEEIISKADAEWTKREKIIMYAAIVAAVAAIVVPIVLPLIHWQ
jgi:hypothetical protein